MGESYVSVAARELEKVLYFAAYIVIDPGTTETQFYDNVRSVCEMMNNNISISVGVAWAEHGKEFNEKIMEADWQMYEQKNAYHQQQQAAQQELLQ